MATASEATGLSWGFGSVVFAPAFEKLAASLRWMFWGTLMQVVGVVALVAPLAALPLRVARMELVALVPVGMVLLVVGGIVVILGEQKCLGLQLPLDMTRTLPGYQWLRGAYWCHLGSWLLRLARNWIGRGPVSLVLLPLQLIGFVLLLLFLRKTADVLARRDLRRLVDAILMLAALTLISGGVLVADRALKVSWFQQLPRAAALAMVVMPVVLFLTTIFGYVVLLGRLSAAAAGFAKYLAAAESFSMDREEGPVGDDSGNSAF
jgi:hypothetical protein